MEITRFVDFTFSDVVREIEKDINPKGEGSADVLTITLKIIA